MDATHAIEDQYRLVYRTIAWMSRRLAGLEGVIRGPRERAEASA